MYMLVSFSARASPGSVSWVVFAQFRPTVHAGYRSCISHDPLTRAEQPSATKPSQKKGGRRCRRASPWASRPCLGFPGRVVLALGPPGAEREAGEPDAGAEPAWSCMGVSSSRSAHQAPNPKPAKPTLAPSLGVLGAFLAVDGGPAAGEVDAGVAELALEVGADGGVFGVGRPFDRWIARACRCSRTPGCS